MSGTASDGEGSVGHEAAFVDAEVDMRLPLEVDWRPDSPRDHVGTIPREPLTRKQSILVRENNV